MRGVEIQSALMGSRIGVCIVECQTLGVLHEGGRNSECFDGITDRCKHCRVSELGCSP